MIKPLAKIVMDGTLVDNTVHTAADGVFRVSGNPQLIEIQDGRGAWLNPKYVWPLIQSAAALDTKSSQLIFRTPEPEYEHNTEDPFLQLNGATPDRFTLVTGNLIGSVKIGGYTLCVSSRFGDEFLKYIIADADGFLELPDHGGMDRGDYQWLLIYLWLVKLKRAFRLGLPKAYVTRSEQLTQVRGRLDPVDYFLNHPIARYRCAYREHSYDNDATRLIARALQHLDASNSRALLRDSHTLNQTFQAATLGKRHSLQDLLTAKPVRNPYYSDYNPVIDLAKQILRNELSDFGVQSQISAFFFDVSMLFEYFVRKLMKRAAGVTFHPKNSRDWTIPSGLPGDRRKLIPDLIFDSAGATYVFDVKYKSFDFRDGVRREDLFQLHTYLGQISNRHTVGGCGFIYPIRESRWDQRNLAATQGIFSSTITQGKRDVPFHVAFLKIPEQGEDFNGSFRKNADEFVKHLQARLTKAGSFAT